MSTELPFHDGIDETETTTRLSPEAMDLAHGVALYEAELREKGRTAERIKYLQGKEFGSKIARLAIHDQTAQFIYHPIPDEPLSDRSNELAEITPIAKWARSTYQQNNTLNGVGGIRDLAFKD